MLRLIIAGGDDTRREELRRSIEKQADWRVCGQAATSAQTLELTLQLSPQIAIIDLALPGMHGLDVIRRIKRLRPECEILALIAYETDDLIRDLLIGGAQACVPIADAAEHLIPAVDALSQHRLYLTPKVMHALLDVFLAQGRSGPKSPATPLKGRERKILQLLAEGRTNSAISDLLGISVKTVETHRALIMKRLGVNSLAELVRYAIRNHVIDVE